MRHNLYLLFLAILPALKASEVPNVAVRGKVSQSSTYNELGNPDNAIDGSTSTDYLAGHCTHTQLETDPWWTVDLTAEFRVFRVAVTNRGDCCAERINNAEIRIGNSSEKGGITNPRCATISSLGPGKTAAFDCGAMQGQYVTVTIPGMRILSLCEVQVFGEKVPSSEDLAFPNKTDSFSGEKEDTEVPNVAVRGKVSQSSTYNELGSPDNAIDGSTSANYLAGHCTHTQLETDPWWTVDLTAEFRVFRVAVTNRGDCCAERINNAEIRIGNSSEKGGITNPRCATISSLGPGKTAAFDCGAMQGQYVTVTIPGMRILSLCEVQVFGEKVPSSEDLAFPNKTDSFSGEKEDTEVPNVAVRGKVFQSSTYNELGNPDNAIDGSTSTDYLAGHCTHTQLETDPWWTVDLTAEFRVFRVAVTNRGDCCAERINNAEIRIGNSSEKGGITNPRCATISSLGPGKTAAFDCGAMQGQYVTVTIPGMRILSLCEVQVFGEKVPSSVPNVAVRGKVSQSSTYNELGSPDNAIDGSTSTDYLAGHCTHTQLETDPWWTVDLTAEFRVFRVAVTNRGDCCAERINNAEIRIGNSSEKGGITNPRCATISSLGPGKTAAFDCGAMQGQYVTVTIPGMRILSLCEVQVFGEKVPSSVTSAIEKWVKQQERRHPRGQNRGTKAYLTVYNAALEGKAFQSSSYAGLGSAEHAIDGSTSSNYLQGQCTHTQLEDNPWWTVDLRANFRVLSVVVTNRGDCCEERIQGAEIRIGHSKDEGGIRNPRCTIINSMDLGETRKFECEGMQGQYVTITIPGTSRYLTLCEVQVFGRRIMPLVPDVALEGKAFQSSTYNKLGVAENAIDGSTAVDFMHNSCTHTERELNPWWTVDLKAEYNVSSVSVTNREDCCAYRLNGAEIRIGNSFEKGGSTNPRCATINSLGAGEARSFNCEGFRGQYVTVTIPRIQFLTLCEVQVFGVLANPPAPKHTEEPKV